jgi:hypothetical protein
METTSNKEYGDLAMLLGGKIKELVHTEEDEEGNIFWGITIEVKENNKKVTKVMWFLSDFEGNAPGAWEIVDKK